MGEKIYCLSALAAAETANTDATNGDVPFESPSNKALNITATVLDMYCVKPLDAESVIRAAQNAKAVLTVEEHAPYGGLGSMVAQVVAENCPRKVKNLTLPDAPVITGTSKEVFAYYGLDAAGIAAAARELVR